LANPESEARRYMIPGLERGLLVMELLADNSEQMGVTAVAERLGIPKNSAFRVLSTLRENGYVERDAAGKYYRLSRKLLALGYASVDEKNLVERSIDVLRELREQTGETTLVATRLGTEGVVLDQVLGHHPVKIAVEVGHRFPLHTSAPGKAMVAYLPEQEQRDVIDHLTYTRFNERTITNKLAMASEMDKVRKLGYATDQAEEIEGVHCVAAPIRNHRGYPLAALWATGPSYRMRSEDFHAIGELVMEAARKVSGRFGYRILQLTDSAS